MSVPAHGAHLTVGGLIVLIALSAGTVYVVMQIACRHKWRRVILQALVPTGKVLLGFGLVWLAPLLLPAWGLYGLYKLGDFVIQRIRTGFRTPEEEI